MRSAGRPTNRVDEALPKVNLATFEHCQHFRAERVEQPHLHVGIALRVAVQEFGEDTFHMLRRSSHLQHPGVPAPDQLSPLAKRTGVIQQTTAIAEQLLAFARQQQAAPDPIKKLEAEFLFEIVDLPGQGGLGNAEVQRRLGYVLNSATVTRSRMPQIHGESLCRIGIED